MEPGYEILSREPFAVRLGGVRHEALPVSAAAVLRFRRAVAAAPDAPASERALEALLRLAFPGAKGDGPPGGRAQSVSRRFFTVPARRATGGDDDADRAGPHPDPACEAVAQLIRAQNPGSPDGTGQIRVDFERVCVLVEAFMGAEWWHDAAAQPRWRTADRFAPWAEVWLAWETMEAMRALHRLDLMQATRAALLADGTHYRQHRTEEQQTAFATRPHEDVRGNGRLHG
jgi:hypothetical protein